jgi:hypothetical protein
MNEKQLLKNIALTTRALTKKHYRMEQTISPGKRKVKKRKIKRTNEKTS